MEYYSAVQRNTLLIKARTWKKSAQKILSWAKEARHMKKLYDSIYMKSKNM